MNTKEIRKELIKLTKSRKHSNRIHVIRLLRNSQSLSIQETKDRMDLYFYENQVCEADGSSVVDYSWDIDGLLKEFGLEYNGRAETIGAVNHCFEHYSVIGYDNPYDACSDAIYRLKEKGTAKHTRHNRKTLRKRQKRR